MAGIHKLDGRLGRVENGLAALRTEVVELRTDVNSHFTELRTDTNSCFAELQTDVNLRFTELQTDVNLRFTELRTDVNFRFTLTWAVGIVAAATIASFGMLWQVSSAIAALNSAIGGLHR